MICPPIIPLCQSLGIPISVYSPPTATSLVYLVAVLLPWSLSHGQIGKTSRIRPLTYNSINSLLPDSPWYCAMSKRPYYHYALRILQFPTSLHKRLYQSGFNTWFSGGDEMSSGKAGVETWLLSRIAKQCKAKRINFQKEEWQQLRVVFIHVGAIQNLHKLPGLAELCRHSPQVTQFWTYGTHVSVNPKFWGMREILLCGKCSLCSLSLR
jgi:hypothetical protein